MTNTESTQEVEQATKTLETSSSANKVTLEEKQAPLIRYFSIMDESTESYVLGYN